MNTIHFGKFLFYDIIHMHNNNYLKLIFLISKVLINIYFIGGVILNFSYKLGIDIGSTTIKLVVLDNDNQVVYKKYMRHLSEIYKSMHDNMILLSDTLKIINLPVQ